MCGIAGYLSRQHLNNDERLIRQMCASLAHRGPDDEATWTDEHIALGHRRLSIVDLSPTGRQPMHSHDGRYIMVYNGEVYGFPALRRILEQRGHAFVGTSDTEVMLASICEWGLREAIEHFNGEFAFALWDRQARQLSLVRDRVGIKPLYYTLTPHSLLFGSELKALRIHPDCPQTINTGALTLYLQHGYISTPHTIYNDVYKLEQGHILTFDLERWQVRHHEAFWQVQDIMRAGLQTPFAGTENEALQQLESLLRDAVKIRMLADVPLGAFLSGGVDSSLVVALMQAQSSGPVRTFSIGFDVAQHDESPYAAAVAAHLGTQHTELQLTGQDALEVIPKIPSIADEPFADSSLVPTYLLSRLTRQDVTVSLSGDGGDELFFGYSRYLRALKRWQRIQRVPDIFRQGIAGTLAALSPNAWDDLLRALPRHLQKQITGDRIHAMTKVLNSRDIVTFYRNTMVAWNTPPLLKTTQQLPTLWNELAEYFSTSDLARLMQTADMCTYMVDDILVKVDRASMAASLEARVPLLDHRFIELVASLPMDYKWRNGHTKWAMRQILYKYVPQDLIERPKQGFAIPIQTWLRKDLRDWAESLLDEKRLREDGLFDSTQVRKKLREHLAGTRDWGTLLWYVLCFQGWHQHQEENPHPEYAGIRDNFLTIE